MSTTPTDWVTRAADDAITARRRGQAGDRLVGGLAVGAGPPGQPARVPHRALRRRRAAPPRRTGAAPARLGRLRPVPQGARGRRPVVRRAHRPPAERRPRPVGLPPVVGRALQGAAPRRAARDGHRHGGGLADRALHLRRLPRAGAARRPAPPRHRGRAGPLPHQEGRPRARPPTRRRRPWPTPSPTTRTSSGATELERFPFKPYCRTCGRDTTTVTAYDDETTDLTYTCDHGHAHTTNLATQDEGKLVWKVDWPMRWAFEHVDFEPAGMDHATPGSSFTVGHELVEKVFGMPRPAWFGYGFVGFAGVQKMSSSAGGAPTAEDALRVLEAPIVRWLYVRRNPKQTFDIDFGPEVVRLYDEWDSLTRKAADPDKRDAPGARLGARRRRRPPARCRHPASSYRSGCCPRSPTSPPARPSRSAASSATRSTTSSRASTRRWRGPASTSTRPTAPTCGRRPTQATLASLDDRQRDWLRLLLDGLTEPLDLDGRDLAGLRRAQAGARHAARRQADRRGRRPTRRSSSACSTGCSSTPSAVRGCPRW